MLYLECNCNHNSASCFCAHSPLWGGPRARGEDRNSIAPTFLQYARDLVFVSFGGMLLPKLPAYFQLHNGRMGNKSVAQLLQYIQYNNNYFCGFLKFQNQWTCTAQWAKKGLSQKMTKQIKLRYWYDFEMFTKWNHTTILKIWIRYFLNNRGNQLQSL